VKCFLVEGKLNSWGQVEVTVPGKAIWLVVIGCGPGANVESCIQASFNVLRIVSRFDLFFNRLFMHQFLVYALGKIYPFSEFL